MKKRMTFDSRILEHMGKDLITSPEVALIELIKNSIDAKSNQIDCNMHSEFSANIVQEYNAPFDLNVIEQLDNVLLKPCIVLQDNGFGMDEATLENGFLKVGTRIKLDDDRFLFGQKGIGRLAAQRLGNILIVETTQKNNDSVYIAIIDWKSAVDNQIDSIEIPFYVFSKSNIQSSYTRLWILDANIDDIIVRPQQQSLFEDEFISIVPDVAAALAFLISPYEKVNDITINVAYNGTSLPFAFQNEYLSVAESEHSFSLQKNNDGLLELKLKMELKPFYIEKIHKTQLGNEVDFNKYKLSAKSYIDLYNKYKFRYEDTLTRTLSEEDIIKLFLSKLRKLYRKKVDKSKKQKYDEYLMSLAIAQVNNLKKICEISGKIYSFKRDNLIGSIYIDFIKETIGGFDNVSVRDIQSFLRQYNGVKLYRNNYRIGFLGNKDNDWIEMQQYRTMGQQFYRFNLGDSLGYVKINDEHQDYIKEISSRLDIFSDEISRTFKDFINYIFNEFFYQFNKSADEITRTILVEAGLIDHHLPEKIERAKVETEKLLKQNQILIDKLVQTKKLLNTNVVLDSGNALIPKEIFDRTITTLESVESGANDTKKIIAQSQVLLSEATVSLKNIEIEAFNNFKLMANGLITETITHELHSLVKGDAIDAKEDWHIIGEYLIDNNVEMYNRNYKSIYDVYNTVVTKIKDIGNLYNLIESTFIKEGSGAEYAYENIGETVTKIRDNFNIEWQNTKIDIQTINLDYTLLLPKGVMLHVFYNLISNSKYWIDYRRKRARRDPSYQFSGNDFIRIERTKRGIEVSDSGCGVFRHMEHILFEALQSGKEDNQGRGMGLYIVKKLLNSMDADIFLSDEINGFGNRFKFIITLPEKQ